MKLIYVKWTDSAGDTENGWQSIEDTNKLQPAEISTGGILIDETDEYVTVGLSLNHEVFWGRFLVLKKLITERKEFEV